jgi:hypothetical protein
MTYAAIDEELATLFAVCWGKKFAELPPDERLLASVKMLRIAIARDGRSPGDARRLMRASGRRSELAAALRVKKAREFMPVLERFAAAHGVEVDDILGPSACHEIALPRHKFIWAMHRELLQSKSFSGFAAGGRDHVCAINSIKRVDRLVAADPALGESLRRLARGEPGAHLRALPGRAA